MTLVDQLEAQLATAQSSATVLMEALVSELATTEVI